jgi:hypothetical protein
VCAYSKQWGCTHGGSRHRGAHSGRGGNNQRPWAPTNHDHRSSAGHGEINDLQLGSKASDYHIITNKRKALHEKYKLEAERSPNEYSPVVPLPDVAGTGRGALVGRKREVRLMVDDGDGGSYLHCFEGTIKAFAGASAKKAELSGVAGSAVPLRMWMWSGMMS